VRSCAEKYISTSTARVVAAIESTVAASRITVCETMLPRRFRRSAHQAPPITTPVQTIVVAMIRR
jgi:hypothetical protein